MKSMPIYGLGSERGQREKKKKGEENKRDK